MAKAYKRKKKCKSKKRRKNGRCPLTAKQLANLKKGRVARAKKYGYKTK